jgi:putative endonuclease
LGERGESAAARYLWWRGYTIVERNCRSTLGEIDLVAVRQRTIVFVEVKSRSSHQAGHPLEAVTPQKQRRLTRAALAYLRRNDLLECAARFDVIAVTWPPGALRPQIVHVPGAFESAERWQMFG